MSAPTKGMVAGQAIISNAQTKEFDEGYDRIFGKAKPERGSWRVDPKTGALVELGADWEPTDGERVPVFTDRYMEGVKAQDGTDISSRTKRREYMKQNNLADHGDISPQYLARRKAEEKRADAKDRRETIARATYLRLKPSKPTEYADE